MHFYLFYITHSLSFTAKSYSNLIEILTHILFKSLAPFFKFTGHSFHYQWQNHLVQFSIRLSDHSQHYLSIFFSPMNPVHTKDSKASLDFVRYCLAGQLEVGFLQIFC